MVAILSSRVSTDMVPAEQAAICLEVGWQVLGKSSSPNPFPGGHVVAGSLAPCHHALVAAGQPVVISPPFFFLPCPGAVALLRAAYRPSRGRPTRAFAAERYSARHACARYNPANMLLLEVFCCGAVLPVCRAAAIGRDASESWRSEVGEVTISTMFGSTAADFYRDNYVEEHGFKGRR